MKNKELIRELKKFNQEDEVHISSDSESGDIKTIHQVAKVQDGTLLEDKNGDRLINDKKYRWINGRLLLVIFPTDEIVTEDEIVTD